MSLQDNPRIPLPKGIETIYHPKRFSRLVLELARRYRNAYRFRRRSKDPSSVEAIYQGSWGNVLNKADWKNYLKLAEFLNPPCNGRIISTLNHGWVEVNRHDFLKYRIQHLHHILETQLKACTSDTKLVEVGCGWGRNLFCLRSMGIENTLQGYELTHEAVEAARSIADHFDVKDITFQQANLITDSLPLENTVVYSYHCLEQIKYNTLQVLEKLIEARPKKVVHFEPAPELMRWWHPRDLANIAYNKLADYQCSLLSELQKLEQQDKVRLLLVERQGFYQLPIQETVCIIWEPVQN